MTHFTSEFLQTVVNTLLPGLPATDSSPAVPSASQVGVDQQLAGHLQNHPDKTILGRALEALIEQADNPEAFISADADTAEALMTQVSLAEPLPFETLLFVAKADYYQSAAVLQAFGWSAAPPQPQGYPLPPFDQSLLNPVSKHPLWRATGEENT